jgi:hypothetical protein
MRTVLGVGDRIGSGEVYSESIAGRRSRRLARLCDACKSPVANRSTPVQDSQLQTVQNVGLIVYTEAGGKFKIGSLGCNVEHCSRPLSTCLSGKEERYAGPEDNC